jgi:toxin ParE1/3/4
MPQSRPYHFHPAAWDEFEAAQKWYRCHDVETSVRFLAAIYDALEDIARWPRIWPEYLHGTRKFVLQKFPYLIVYREKESAVRILAIAHGRRRPGYWKERA